MTTPTLPPPPLSQAIAGGDGRFSPTWQLWLQRFWDDQATQNTSLGGALALTVSLPADVGPSAVLGTAITATHGDHVHAHGNQAGGALHADVIAGGASGFMTGTQATKLAGIATGATAEVDADGTRSGRVNLLAQTLGAGRKQVDNLTSTGDVVAVSHRSSTANIASAGAVRLASSDLVEWSNSGNTGNNTLGTSSDRLQYNSVNIPTISSSDTLTNKALDSTDTLTSVAMAGTHTGAHSYSGAITMTSTLGVTGDFAVNTSKFTVTAASGNVVSQGTLTVGSAGTTQLFLRYAAATDGGGYLTSTGIDDFQVSGGASYNGTNWVAKVTTPGIWAYTNQTFKWFADTTAVAGNTFTPTLRMSLTGAGVLAVTSHIGAGISAPTYRLEVVRALASGGQVRIGVSSSDSGLYFLSTAAAGGYISAGANFDGTNWIAKSTDAGIYTYNGTNHEWYANTSLSAGSSYSPTRRMALSSTGQLSVGHAAAPGFQLDLGSTTANTKLALWNNTTTQAGMGVTTSDFRFHLDLATSQFSWRPTPAGAAVMTLSGAGALAIASGGTVTAPAYISSTANAAAAGAFRAARSDTRTWRNNGNSADNALGCSTSDRLQWNSVDIPTISSTDTFTNKTLGHIIVDTTDNSGTPGNTTINKLSGKAAIASTATACTVTNSTVTTASRVIVTPIDLDATLTSFKVVPAASSFTVTGNAAATAAWKFSFLVIN